MKNPYISRVQIKNFRNFKKVDVELNQKQVIIGENSVGKTNFLRALQLIFDRNLTDFDRQLLETDFHDSLYEPLKNGEEIEISIEVKGYEHNRKLVAQFEDAVISDNPPTLKFKYKFSPKKDEKGNILDYQYQIYKGKNEDKYFTSEDRSFINISVIKALRDVERELKANKNSPLYRLVKQYEISKQNLEKISDALYDAAEELLELDEIVHIQTTLQERFNTLSGLQYDSDISLRTFDIDTERLLYTLQVYMGFRERPVSELSLGLANILYVALMLLLFKDKTVPPILKKEAFDSLISIDSNNLLRKWYRKGEQDNYILSDQIDSEGKSTLYNFLDQNIFKVLSFTILAVEEPEAHLHPTLQRLIYREVLHKSEASVIFTSHSTFIASVTPLESIVHIRKTEDSSKIFSTANLSLKPMDKIDIERYIDAKRGEIYFGKGVILIEGISEEYIIPRVAELSGNILDDYGVVICNINSTNFKPYIQILNSLSIPWISITDGDYYEIKKVSDTLSEEGDSYPQFHIMESDNKGHYRGNETAFKILTDLNILDKAKIPEEFPEQDNLLRKHGFFVGKYTLEVDLMENSNADGIEVLKKTYSELARGGKLQRKYFDEALEKKEYWDALKKIESNISKGRFAQRLSENLLLKQIPVYLQSGIETIIKKVKEVHE